MMWIRPGRTVTVSLTDGSSLTGRTLWAWPGRVRLCGVTVSGADGQAAGVVVVYKRSVLTMQVV
jgi:hypothetical protein